MDRRDALKTIVAAGGLGVSAWWARGVADAAVVAGVGPYGALGAPDLNGIALPAGFRSRVVARSGQAVPGTSFVWHPRPDGGACFGRADGGWVYVSSSEGLTAGSGGVGAISFGPNGQVVGAHRVLTGTTHNCSGGATPWGTWLSCEENAAGGRVLECNPYGGATAGTFRPALGRFNHEAAVVDPATGDVYLTEDEPLGRLYRFVPARRNDLSAGALYAASVTGGAVTWVPASAAAPDRQPTTTPFNGGEGACVHRGVLYVTTKGDNRVWALDLATQRLSVLYDAATTPGGALRGVDAICAHARSGDLYVCEDGGNMELCILSRSGGTVTVAPFLRIDGQATSELTGVAFNRVGDRLYFSSQRGADGNGITYEITGPFRNPPVIVDDQPPTPPPDVAAAVSGADVIVTWGAATDLPVPGAVGVASYWVVRDWGPQWLVSAKGPLQYVDRGVTPGPHRYQVHAVDAAGRISAASTTARVTV